MKLKKGKILALVGAAVLASGIFGGLIGHTWSSTPDWTAQKPNSFSEINVGATKTVDISLGSIQSAVAGNSSIATVSVSTSGSSLTIKGKKAGATSVALGTDQEYMASVGLQIVDPSLMESYAFKFSNKQGIYMESGSSNKLSSKKISDIVTTTPSDALTQTASNTVWSSSNTDAVTVDQSGNLTAVATGGAVINASFTDKYGQTQSMHYLVAVNMNLSSVILGPDANGDYWKPVQPEGVYEHVNADGTHNSNKPEYVYTKDGDPTTSSTVAVKGADGTYYTETPVGGNIWVPVTSTGLDTTKPVWGGNDKTPGNSDDKDAVSNGNGTYYVGYPTNIWTPVKSDGTLDAANPIYGGADGQPGGTDNAPAVKGADSNYYVEDSSLPSGGNGTKNVWAPVKDGTVDTAAVVWGGSDGKPGSSDDKNVKLFGSDYWVVYGENVYADVAKATGNLGALTGGGLDLDPSTSGVTNVIDNTAIDGHYYIGPFTDTDGTQYYVGDDYLHTTNMDKLVNSENASSIYSTDAKYFRTSEGTMVSTKPSSTVDAVSVSVSPASATVPVTTTQQLTATATPSNTTESPVWSSSNTNVASVDANGLVTGKKPGSAVITAQYKSTSANATINVTAAVTFESNGGSAVASQTISTENGTATKPDDPTKDGYTFGGWYTDAALTTAYEFSTPVTVNTTLYAKWGDSLISGRTLSDISDWVILTTKTDADGKHFALVTTKYLQGSPMAYSTNARSGSISVGDTNQLKYSDIELTTLPAWYASHIKSKYIVATNYANGTGDPITGIPAKSNWQVKGVVSSETGTDAGISSGSIVSKYDNPDGTSMYFLLSEQEVVAYLSGTEYAAAKVEGAASNSGWWTRTSYIATDAADQVCSGSADGTAGPTVYSDYTTLLYVRPAMWIQY